MRPNTARRRVLLGVGVAAVAAVVATSASGVSTSGTITRIAGSGVRGFSGDGGPAIAARLNYPRGVAVDGKGNVYIADLSNLRIRKVSPSGTITTFAGNGRYGSSGDGGPATSARLYYPYAVAADRLRNVYIIDGGEDDEVHPVVRKVSPRGTITTFAGTGIPGFSGDGGPATAAQLSGPRGVAVDRKGNVYISDGSRVRKVNAGGTITTVAGTGRAGFSGDGGPATSAQISPQGIAVDRKGSVYIADQNNLRIRKVSPGGTITTVAGTGRAGFSGDGGPATSARLSYPAWVAVDAKGNVYITDEVRNRVRRVSPGGTITTIAGTGRAGSSGDGGPATSARLYYPAGVAVDGQGNLYIVDKYNQRVRKVSTRPHPIFRAVSRAR